MVPEVSAQLKKIGYDCGFKRNPIPDSAAEGPAAPTQVWVVASYDQALSHEGRSDRFPRLSSNSFTPNRLGRADGSQYLVVSLFDVNSGLTTDLGLSSLIPMVNGAFRLKNGLIVVAMQGNLKQPAGLASLDLYSRQVTILTKGVAGQQFNRPNDVVQSNDLSIWLTAPPYGYGQGFRPNPPTGNWVWRLDALGRSQCLLIDRFAKPNSIAFSGDLRYVYFYDSDYIGGNGKRNSLQPRTIYRYRVIDTPEGPLVTDRIIFCVVTNGIPDGIKVGGHDRIWTATGAGLEVFSNNGLSLAVIPIKGEVNIFALTVDGGAYLMGQTRNFGLDS